MRRLWLLLLAIVVLLFCVRSHATVYRVTPSSALQTVINGTVAGDTVSFGAGTFNIAAALNLKCGVTYTGPVATPATAILNATFTRQSADIFNLATGSAFANPCTQPTTIEYLNFANAGGILVQTSFTNLTIQFNQFTNIPCCNGGGPDTAISFNGSGPSSNVQANLTNTLIQWNTIGDSASCTTPTNGMTFIGPGTDTDIGSNCGGIATESTVGFGTNGTSTWGMKILNNKFFHVGEAVYWGCPNPPGSNSHGVCEPNTAGYESAGSGVETRYVTAEFNDFAQIHAAPWEEQPQVTQGIIFQYNSEHDWVNPYYHSYGQSMACCVGQGAAPALSPYLVDSNNVVLFNTTPSVKYAYGSEAWGLNANYNNNLYQGLNNSSNTNGGIVYGYGPLATINNNTLCGSAFGGYIVSEGLTGQPGAPPMSGNVTGAAPCTAKTSVAPTISPAAGSQSYPLTVTMTDPGFTSGAQPLGNHSIYYTTDGSTPTVSSALYTGPITLPAAATVKAIGMWGTGANATSYPAGYGFVPSSAVTANYTGGTPSCAIASGASQSTIGSTITTCPSGNTVTFGAGTFNMNASVNVPCGVSISGPTVSIGSYTGIDGYVRQGYTPTAAISWSGGNHTQPFIYGSCSTPRVFQYMECNMNHPSPDGGQCIVGSSGGGISKLTIQYNYFHGNQGGVTSTSEQDSLVEFSGSTGSTYDDSDTVQWNRFGATGDCSNIMQNYTYAGFSGNGGFCSGLSEHTNMSNFLVQNNDFQMEENESKFYESSGGCINCVWQYNDFSEWHRIAMENQSNSGASFPTNQEWQYNSVHDAYFPGVPTFGWSIANGCFNGASPPNPSSCISNADYNVIMANSPLMGQSRYADAIEWFGSRSHVNYNLLEGFANSIMIGVDGSLTANNNTIYNTGGGTCTVGNSSGGYFNTEENPLALSLASGTNSCNSSSNSVQLTSQAPVISPASGSFSGTQTVMITCPSCVNRDVNTTFWYTTDGSTPVPGTSKFYTAPFTVTSPSTVKAVGMWGAPNQPASYQSGWGYAPSAVATAAYTTGGQYYLSTTGSDSNSGTSPGSPWLSPNHAVNCGDTITAAPGNYSAANFYQGKWGTVTCPAANNVAWLQCATFDACKISATTSQAMFVSASFWGVSGWEATDSWSFGNCFYTQTESSQSVHHVIFANDIANGCAGGGFVAYNSGGAASDYYAYIGDIAYGTGTSSSVCASGFSMGFLKQLDANAGTHLYVADTYAWGNVNPLPTCASPPTAPTDGEGLIYDTLNSTGFTGQAVAENNIYVGNDGRGIEGNNNTAAHFIFDHNTTYGNNQQAGQAFPNNNGELYINEAGNASVTGNLAMTNQATTGGSAIYAASVSGTGSGISITGNWLYSAAGNTTQGPAGDFGSNVTGTNPAFASTTIPGAPNCSGTASVTACVASLISGFTPTNASAQPYGYQPVSNTSTTNANFPQWLCSGGALIPGFPAGLVTPGCGGSGAPPTLTGGSLTGPSNTLAVGASPLQFTANGTYSDGNPRTLPDSLGNAAVWSSSNGAILSVSNTGSAACLTTGIASVQVTSSPTGKIFSPWTMTCTTGSNPTLTGGFLGNGATPCTGGGVNTQIIGTAAIQFTACGTYSDGNTRPLPDSFGNSASWSSSNGTIMSVSSSGLANCLTSGPADVVAASGSVNFNHWTVGCSNPTQSGGNLTNPGSVNKIAVGGGTVPFGAVVFYSNSPAINPLPDGFGNVVNSWSVIPGSSTCGTVNSSGVFTPTTAGTCNVKATCTACLVAPTQWTMTVTASATVVSVALTTTGGVTGLLIGNTNQLTATATYSDATTTNCTTTDSHGNVAGTWTSTTPAKATISSSGLVTGVAAGSTTFTAICGGITSSALPLTILPNGVYTIKATGPWKFTGKVHF